jgi:hypothetical protein
LSIVQYKSYCNDKLHGFPILSLCFKNPFNSTKLGLISTKLNDSSYSEFLKGNYFSQDILQSDFKENILDISEYGVSDWVEWRNGSSKTYSHRNYSSFIIKPTYAGFWRDEFYNCYGMQINCDEHVQVFFMLLKNDIFPSKTRPTAYDFFTLLHYPNQLLRSTRNIRYKWPKRTTNGTYSMDFVITGMEIVKHRNKRQHPCNEDWKNHDNIVLMRRSKSVACRAPYLYHNISIKSCSTENEIKREKFSIRYDEYDYIPPCLAIEILTYQ